MVELTQAAQWHRQVAALAAAADRAGVAEEHLPAVRARLLGQQAKFADLAVRTGAGVPALAPSPTEISAAAPALGDLSRPAVTETFRVSHSTLDAIDSALDSRLPSRPLAGPPTYGPAMVAPPAPGVGVPRGAVALPPPAMAGAFAPAPTGVARWPAPVRNALVYGGYALAVLVVQVVLLALVSEETLPLLAPLCLFVLPAFAWMAGWFTVGMVFRPLPGTTSVKRTPRLGVVICLVPNLLLCAGLGVLFAIDRINT